MDKIKGEGGGGGGRWVWLGWGGGWGENADNCNWTTIKTHTHKKNQTASLLKKKKITTKLIFFWHFLYNYCRTSPFNSRSSGRRRRGGNAPPSNFVSLTPTHTSVPSSRDTSFGKLLRAPILTQTYAHDHTHTVLVFTASIMASQVLITCLLPRTLSIVSSLPPPPLCAHTGLWVPHL